jgi:hypothetical protein
MKCKGLNKRAIMNTAYLTLSALLLSALAALHGGDKLWPAPQGWNNDAQWPGPPDAVLDGQPYRAEMLDGGAALRLTSRDDPRSGIRFSPIEWRDASRHVPGTLPLRRGATSSERS